MKKKFERIKGKKRLYAQISVATGKAFGTIQNHWFVNLPDSIPKANLDIVNREMDNCIEFEKAVEKIELKYFGI